MNDDRMDRFARGELGPAEARALAQQSLDDPELFDTLTCTALASAAVSQGGVWRPRRRWVGAFGAIAAALLLAGIIYPLLPSRQGLRPALFSVARGGQPVLLVRDAGPAQKSAEVFRGAESERAPRATGSIASLQERAATVDLGSLDGLEKGAEIEILRGGELVGRATVAAVFRDHCRADLISGAAQKGDSARVSPATHLGALVQFAEAASARGDEALARSTAEEAVEWARSSQLPASQALVLLGGFEMRAGALDAAAQRYREAGEDADAINGLAVVAILRGDYDGAKKELTDAIGKMPAHSTAHARAANNLGVLAELRRDRSDAKRWYGEAIQAFPDSSPERREVENNLARIRGSR